MDTKDITQQLYKPFKKLFKGPIDVESVFNSIEEAELYAKSSTAYDGQIISVVSDSSVAMFVISKGTLLRVPLSITSNDNSYISIEISADENGIVLNPKLKISKDENNGIELRESGLYSSKSVDVTGLGKGTVNKFVTTVSESCEIKHNLGTTDITMNIWDVNTNKQVITDMKILDENTVKIDFSRISIRGEDVVVGNFKIVIMG